MGLSHKFDDETSAKVKVNDKGKLDGVLKHKLSKTTTACIATGANISDITSGKSEPLPFGLSLDIKF